MGLRDFFRRRKRSKARSEVENPSGARPSLPFYSESTPDLRIGTSTEPSKSQTIHTSPLSPHDKHRPFSVGGPVSSPGEAINLEPSGPIVESGAIDENESNLLSLAFSGARFILNGVKESADAVGPLKSVAGSLCFILDNRQVCDSLHLRSKCSQAHQQMKANKESIVSLTPRVKALAELLCVPASEGHVMEKSRRSILER